MAGFDNLYNRYGQTVWSTITSGGVTETKAIDTLEVTNDIIINSESLNSRLKRIELVLNIPTRDLVLEKKYPQLKKIWEQYNSELEKLKSWETIKNSK
jgi:hypothetical protein